MSLLGTILEEQGLVPMGESFEENGMMDREGCLSEDTNLVILDEATIPVTGASSIFKKAADLIKQDKGIIKKGFDLKVTSADISKNQTGIDSIFLKVNKAVGKNNPNNGATRVIKNIGGVTFIYYVSQDKTKVTAPIVYLYKKKDGNPYFKPAMKYIKKAQK